MLLFFHLGVGVGEGLFYRTAGEWFLDGSQAFQDIEAWSSLGFLGLTGVGLEVSSSDSRLLNGSCFFLFIFSKVVLLVLVWFEVKFELALHKVVVRVTLCNGHHSGLRRISAVSLLHKDSVYELPTFGPWMHLGSLGTDFLLGDEVGDS